MNSFVIPPSIPAKQDLCIFFRAEINTSHDQRVLGDNLSAVRRTRSQLKHLPSYRMLRGMIVGEAVVALATPEYLAERVIQNGHPGQNASAFVVVKKISNEHPQPCGMT
jgi:hypothetical protein